MHLSRSQTWHRRRVSGFLRMAVATHQQTPSTRAFPHVCRRFSSNEIRTPLRHRAEIGNSMVRKDKASRIRMAYNEQDVPALLVQRGYERNSQPGRLEPERLEGSGVKPVPMLFMAKVE